MILIKVYNCMEYTRVKVQSFQNSTFENQIFKLVVRQ